MPWTKEQREVAKRLNQKLVEIAITEAGGKGLSRITLPADEAQAEIAEQALLKIVKLQTQKKD